MLLSAMIIPSAAKADDDAGTLKVLPTSARSTYCINSSSGGTMTNSYDSSTDEWTVNFNNASGKIQLAPQASVPENYSWYKIHYEIQNATASVWSTFGGLYPYAEGKTSTGATEKFITSINASKQIIDSSAVTQGNMPAFTTDWYDVDYYVNDIYDANGNPESTTVYVYQHNKFITKYTTPIPSNRVGFLFFRTDTPVTASVKLRNVVYSWQNTAFIDEPSDDDDDKDVYGKSDIDFSNSEQAHTAIPSLFTPEDNGSYKYEYDNTQVNPIGSSLWLYAPSEMPLNTKWYKFAVDFKRNSSEETDNTFYVDLFDTSNKSYTLQDMQKWGKINIVDADHQITFNEKDEKWHKLEVYVNVDYKNNTKTIYAIYDNSVKATVENLTGGALTNIRLRYHSPSLTPLSYSINNAYFEWSNETLMTNAGSYDFDFLNNSMIDKPYPDLFNAVSSNECQLSYPIGGSSTKNIWFKTSSVMPNDAKWYKLSLDYKRNTLEYTPHYFYIGWYEIGRSPSTGIELTDMQKWSQINVVDSNHAIKIDETDGAWHKLDLYVNIDYNAGKKTLYTVYDNTIKVDVENLTSQNAMGDIRLQLYNSSSDGECSYTIKNLNVAWSNKSLIPEEKVEPKGYIKDSYNVENNCLTIGKEYTAQLDYISGEAHTTKLIFTPFDGSTPTETSVKDNSSVKFTPTAEGEYKLVINTGEETVLATATSSYALSENSVIGNKGSLKVAYLGGSITLGSGASPASNRWSTKLTEYLNSLNIGTSFTEINAGIGGTGAEYGVLRTTRDVVQYDPDVVFVEFAVNDQDLADLPASRAYEGIIRKLMSLDKVPYIVCVGVVSNSDKRTKSSLHKKIAEKYGLKYIDLQDYMDSVYGKAEPGTNKSRDALYTSDNVHPSNAGYQFYTDTLKDCINNGTFQKPVDNGAYVSNYIKTSGVFINAAELNQKGLWTAYGDGDWDSSNLSNNGSGLLSANPDDELTMTFKGTVAVIGHRIGRDMGKMIITLDGVSQTIDCYYGTTNQPVTWYSKTDLKDTTHTISIKPAGDKKANSTSNQIKIDFLITSEDNHPDFKSVTKSVDINENSVTVTAKSAIPVSGDLIVAAYNDDGTLNSVALKPVALTSGISQSIDFDINTSNASKLNVYMWQQNQDSFGLEYEKVLK